MNCVLSVENVKVKASEGWIKKKELEVRFLTFKTSMNGSDLEVRSLTSHFGFYLHKQNRGIIGYRNGLRRIHCFTRQDAKRGTNEREEKARKERGWVKERERESKESMIFCIRSHCSHSYLSVFLILLVVVISFESKFGSTDMTLQASFVEEGEVFEWSNLVHGIDSVATSQALVLVRHRIEPFADGHILCSGSGHDD